MEDASMEQSFIGWPEFGEIRGAVEDVINHIYSEEWFLIHNGASEWTIAAQFHYWIRHLWPENFPRNLNFDSEYNLMSYVGDKGFARKLISVNGEKLRVRPDFLIHKRDNSSQNILWVEMKRHWGKDWNDDLFRVRAVTQSKCHEKLDYVLGYNFGLGILFHKREVFCQWYKQNRFHEGRLGRFVSESKLEWNNCEENAWERCNCPGVRHTR